jgi:hypothetical protein
MLKLMKSQSLKKETKCQRYKSIILATVMYGSEIWARWTLSKAPEREEDARNEVASRCRKMQK